MVITNVTTYLVRPRWGFVKIETDGGLTGWGEAVIEGQGRHRPGLCGGDEGLSAGGRPHADRGPLECAVPGRLLPGRPHFG